MYRAQLPEAPARHDRRALVKDRRGMVLGWSRRSRTRGEFVLQSLDWSPLFDGDQQPGMLTLTLPGDLWEFTVPSPRAYKNIVNRLQRLWARAWGSAPVGAWKMEFQERGAVHLHLLTVPPSGLSGGRAHANGSSRLVWSRGDLVSLNTGGLEFLSWISLTWAKLVGTHKFEELHPQPLVMRESYERRRKVAFLNHVRIGADFSRSDMVRYMDPRSISMYFIQHGHFTAKEYQNQMPAHWANAVRAGAPSGQYWGYWGLESTGATVELDPVRRESADNAYYVRS